MAAKPIKTLELYYSIVHFFLNIYKYHMTVFVSHSIQTLGMFFSGFS